MKLFLSIVLLFSLQTFAQSSFFQFEPYIGAQHIYHHGCSLEDKSDHRGITISSGFRLNFDISNRFTIVTGYSMNNIAGNNLIFPTERLVRLDLKYRIGHFKNMERADFTAEIGLEWLINFKLFKYPLYLGTQFHINDNLDWNLRVKPPSILVMTDVIGTFPFVESSIESGISYRLRTSPAPKFVPRHGNPFILQ